MPAFIVHEHHARHLHFDFRLEMDGVLKSWAVPKGIPVDSGVKRLAVGVEDHALEYGSFEGAIPEREYGAGKVAIWDKGDYVLLERRLKLMRFELRGKRLTGEYVLLFMKHERGQQQWLIFKKTPNP